MKRGENFEKIKNKVKKKVQGKEGLALNEEQKEIIMEIVKGLKKLELENNIDIPPELCAEAVVVIYDEVVK